MGRTVKVDDGQVSAAADVEMHEGYNDEEAVEIIV